MCVKCRVLLPANDKFFGRRAGKTHVFKSECRTCLSRRPRSALARAKEAERKRARRAVDAEYAAKERERSANRYHNDAAHRDRLRAASKAYRRDRLTNDPGYRLRCRLSKRLAKVMGGAKAGRSFSNWTNYTGDELARHMERQFCRGMSWGNYGVSWHVDHIVPCCSFDHADDEAVRACWSLSNLRPLFAAENIRKSGRRVTLL